MTNGTGKILKTEIESLQAGLVGFDGDLVTARAVKSDSANAIDGDEIVLNPLGDPAQFVPRDGR